MYEDTPQELVHDLFSEAVFGDHPLGRPVIGTAEVISTVSRRALAGYHRTAYAPGNVVVAAAGNLDARPPRRAPAAQRAPRRRARARGHPRPPAARAAARPGLRFQRKDTEQYHLCLGATGHLALGPPPLRGVAARLDPRRLRLVAALPGDPREARHGVLRLQLRVAVHRHRPHRRLRRHARGEPRARASRSASSRSARSRPGGCARASSSARRRASRAASSSRSSRRRTA